MNILAEELEKHKRKRPTSDKESVPNKYQKRADLERENVEQVKREEGEKKRKAKEKEEQKLKQIVETYKPSTTKIEEKSAYSLPTEEVKKRLRVRIVPITLFGEDDTARAERLRELELKEPMELLPQTLEGSAFFQAAKQEEEEEDVEIQKRTKKKMRILTSRWRTEKPLVMKKSFCFILENLLTKWEKS